MQVLVTGANGQLGHELARTVPPGVDARFLDRAALDLAGPDVEERVLALAPRVALVAPGLLLLLVLAARFGLGVI